jgi:hypothetical protein
MGESPGKERSRFVQVWKLPTTYVIVVAKDFHRTWEVASKEMLAMSVILT